MNPVPVQIKPKSLQRDDDQVGYRQRRSDVMWVDIEDEQDPNVIWRWDLLFMLSYYSCGYGTSCPGMHEDPSVGCCTHGTQLNWYGDGGEAEINKLQPHVDRLTPQQWQKHGWAQKHGWHRTFVDDDVEEDEEPDEYETTVVYKDTRCVFSNDLDFPGGAGCALHIQALQEEANPNERKPVPCVVYPLTIEEDWLYDDTVQMFTIKPLSNYEWEPNGSFWCSSSVEMNTAVDPVWASMREELILMVGEGAYEQLVDWVLNHSDVVKMFRPNLFLPTQWDMQILPDDYWVEEDEEEDEEGGKRDD